MRSAAIVVLVGAGVGLLSMSAPARAQSLEVGGGFSLSCEPFESSLCHRSWGRADALYGSVWATDDLAFELRVAHLDGPASRIVAVGEQIAPHEWFYRSYAVRDEHRTVLQASALYHFLDKRSVRPFVGGGPGILWWAADSTCPRDLFECQRVVPGGRPGRLTHSTWVLSVVGGVAVHPWRGLTFRGGVRGTSHPVALWRIAADVDRRPNYLAEQLSEYFVSLGYRW